jgi:hypothetical protein
MTNIRKSLAEHLRDASVKKVPTQQLDYNGLLTRILGKKPRITQGKFINSPAPFKAYKGMAGCAKTSTVAGSIVLRALLQPGFRGAIGRYDYNKLMGTTAQRVEEMLQRVSPSCIVGRDKTPPMKLQIQAFDGSVSTIDFIGLKEYPGSYEWHRVAVDEADECDERTIQGLKSRLRAPSPEGVNPNYGLDLAFNPPDETHFLYEACTGKTHDGKFAEKWLELFEPSEGENDENLPIGYYEANFKGMPQDMLDRLKHGKWGASFKGAPVYPQYSTRLHMVENIPFDGDLPLLRFWDFGYRRPACIFVQMDDEYRLRVLAEILGENEEAKPFIEKVKAFTNRNFRAGGFLDFGDPAAVQKKDTGSTLTVLENAGIHLIFCASTIENGLRKVRFLLERIIKGIPAITVSRKNAPITSRMFQGGYRLGPNHRPLKDGFYDHIADAFRYGVYNIFNDDGDPNALPEWTREAGEAKILGAGIPESIEYSD